MGTRKFILSACIKFTPRVEIHSLKCLASVERLFTRPRIYIGMYFELSLFLTPEVSSKDWYTRPISKHTSLSKLIFPAKT